MAARILVSWAAATATPQPGERRTLADSGTRTGSRGQQGQPEG